MISCYQVYGVDDVLLTCAFTHAHPDAVSANIDIRGQSTQYVAWLDVSRATG